jgi:hypothetical protein
MTLALAIKATDAIIVAADSRGTIGDPRGLTAVNDTQQKIFQFGMCGLAISGAAELTQAIMDEFGKKGLNNPQNIDDAVGTLTQAAGIYDGWFQGINLDQRPGILFVLGGYRVPADGSAPIPMVYLMTSNTRFAPQLAGAYPMMVGVPQYAVYLSHRYYDPAMTADTKSIADGRQIGLEAVARNLGQAKDALAKIANEMVRILAVALADAIADDGLLCTGHGDENVLIALGKQLMPFGACLLFADETP